MIRRPPRSTRTDTLFPTRRSSDLIDGLKAQIAELEARLVEQDAALRRVLDLLIEWVERDPENAPNPANSKVWAEIGRASCRERVCQYVEISVVAVSLKKKKE